MPNMKIINPVIITWNIPRIIVFLPNGLRPIDIKPFLMPAYIKLPDTITLEKNTKIAR